MLLVLPPHMWVAVCSILSIQKEKIISQDVLCCHIYILPCRAISYNIYQLCTKLFQKKYLIISVFHGLAAL